MFSKWIRNRDKKCVTCGGPPDHAGHFWHGVLDFDEININAQCAGCNTYRDGMLATYSTYLLDKYGLEEFNALKQRHYLALAGEKKTDEEYMAIIEKYTL